jgi:tuftelin-interacting protein 11
MDRSRNISFDPSRLTKATAADYSSSDSDAGEDDEYVMPSRGPGDHEFADFNPRKRRRTGRNSKESAALGIFGSDSEDEGHGRNWKRKTLRSKGVTFVSQGKPAAVDSEEDDYEEEGQEDSVKDEMDNTMSRPANGAVDTEDDDEDDEVGGVGLGFSSGATSAAPTMGRKPQAQHLATNMSTPRKPFTKATFDGSTPLGKGFTPSSANAPVLNVKDDDSPAPRASLPSAFSAPGRGGKAKTNPKSFGARMMAKMGYVEGQGLGAEGQGRNVIIEANLRPQKIGLGAVKEKSEKERQEEKRQARLRGEEVVDSEEEEKKKKAARKKRALAGGLSSGAGSGASTPRRQKPKYLTLDEIKKAAPGLKIPDAFTPILDLTGPGKKMLTSSSGLMTPTRGAPAAESVEAVESRKLARRAQTDFMAILEEWRSLQERKAYLALQLQQEQQELEEFNAGLEGNRAIVASCDKLSHPTQIEEADQQTGLSRRLSQIIGELKVADTSISDDLLPKIKDELTAVAVAALHPTFKAFLDTWDPLEDPKPRFLDDMTSIASLLGHPRPVNSQRKSSATPFEAMMYKLWLPRVASAVRQWKVRHSDQMLAVFEAWEKLMPRFVRAQLLEQDIVRKLEEAITEWQPRRKEHQLLPHVWIFPWLQYMPPRHLDPKSSNGLIAGVRRKFRRLFDVWDFSRGVIPGLKQWKEVLRPSRSQNQWRPLVVNHLLGSMGRYLRTNFRVDPQDQEPYLEMLAGVFEWLSIIDAPTIGEVIVAEIFPMWHDVLYQWLITDEANYEEIGEWFLWWKDEVFPNDIRSLPSIAAEFDKGTALIDKALDLGDRVATELEAPQKGPALQADTSTRDKNHHRRHHHRHEAQPAPVREEAPPATFKSIVEDWCAANDLQFMPERKKVHAEGPLYRITARGDGKGGVLVYFKGDRLFAETRKDGVVEIRADREADLIVLMEYAQ